MRANCVRPHYYFSNFIRPCPYSGAKCSSLVCIISHYVLQSLEKSKSLLILCIKVSHKKQFTISAPLYHHFGFRLIIKLK